jgi:hypothetical protein
MSVPNDLRAQLAADYGAVRPLPSPMVRALWVTPLAMLALLAAPLFFNVRGDVDRLGVLVSWGASLLQVGLGFIVIAAALRESIPGRSWSARALAGWIALPAMVVIAVTLISFQLSAIPVRRGFWFVGALCLGSSAATALPVIALANVIAAQAYPVRPAIMGLLLGLGGGLMADAGWRLFCHFGEPAHVLPAHAGGVLLAALAGAAIAVTLRRPAR